MTALIVFQGPFDYITKKEKASLQKENDYAPNAHTPTTTTPMTSCPEMKSILVEPLFLSMSTKPGRPLIVCKKSTGHADSIRANPNEH